MILYIVILYFVFVLHFNLFRLSCIPTHTSNPFHVRRQIFVKLNFRKTPQAKFARVHHLHTLFGATPIRIRMDKMKLSSVKDFSIFAPASRACVKVGMNGSPPPLVESKHPWCLADIIKNTHWQTRNKRPQVTRKHKMDKLKNVSFSAQKSLYIYSVWRTQWTN